MKLYLNACPPIKSHHCSSQLQLAKGILRVFHKTLIVPSHPLLKAHLSVKSLQKHLAVSWLALTAVNSLAVERKIKNMVPYSGLLRLLSVMVTEWVAKLQEASPRWCSASFGLLVLLLDGCPSAPADRCSGAWRLQCRPGLHFSAPGVLCHLHFPLLARLLLPSGCSLAPSFWNVYLPPGMSKLSGWISALSLKSPSLCRITWRTDSILLFSFFSCH